MKILLVDIETSPNLCWTFGTRNAFISWDAIVEPTRVICFAAKWLGDKNTMFYSEWQHTHDGMIDQAYALLTEADVVIHFNGEKFDELRLNQEFAQRGYGPPAPFQRIDLWRCVNKAFDLPSQKLAYTLTHFGLPNKVETGGIGLWIALMNQEGWAYRKMETYNRNDVEIMEPLYKKLLPWIKGHPNLNLYGEGDGWHCPSCGSESVQKRGVARTQVSAFQRYRCNECGTWSREGKSIARSDLR